MGCDEEEKKAWDLMRLVTLSFILLHGSNTAMPAQRSAPRQRAIYLFFGHSQINLRGNLKGLKKNLSK